MCALICNLEVGPWAAIAMNYLFLCVTFVTKVFRRWRTTESLWLQAWSKPETHWNVTCCKPDFNQRPKRVLTWSQLQCQLQCKPDCKTCPELFARVQSYSRASSTWLDVHCTASETSETKIFKFRWFLGPSEQNELYHTPILSKIWDLRDRIFFGGVSL